MTLHEYFPWALNYRSRRPGSEYASSESSTAYGSATSDPKSLAYFSAEEFSTVYDSATSDLTDIEQGSYSARDESRCVSEEDNGYNFFANHIGSFVYGGLDGIITTFAVVSGAWGAGIGKQELLIFGFATMCADALSMGLGAALSAKAENEYNKKNFNKEIRLKNRDENLYLWNLNCHVKAKYQLSCDPFASLNSHYITDQNQQSNVLVDTKVAMQDCLDLPEDGQDWDGFKGPLLEGLVVFGAFLLFGIIPLVVISVVANVFSPGLNNSIIVSCLVTACALFFLGAKISSETDETVMYSGFKILGLGTVCSATAYLLGELVASFAQIE